MSYLPCPCSHIPPLSNPGKRTRQRAVSAQHHERGRCPQDLTHLLGVGLGSFTGLGGSSSTDEEDSRLRCLRRRSLCCSSSSSSVLCLARLFGVEHKVVVRLCVSQGSDREKGPQCPQKGPGGGGRALPSWGRGRGTPTRDGCCKVFSLHPADPGISQHKHLTSQLLISPVQGSSHLKGIPTLSNPFQARIFNL